MNNVSLIGRLTKDPEVRYMTGAETPITTITLAIDAYMKKDGTKSTDFPRVTLFGKQAQTAEKYLKKGQQVGITGRIHTSSYKNKNGDTVYTTDVVADKLFILEWGKKEDAPTFEAEQARQNINQTLGINATWENIGADDIPF